MARVGLATVVALAFAALGALLVAGWYTAFGPPESLELFSGNGEGIFPLFGGTAGGLVIGAVLGWFLPDYRRRPKLVGVVLAAAVTAAVPFVIAAHSIDDLTDSGGPHGLGLYLGILCIPVSVASVLALRRYLAGRALS